MRYAIVGTGAVGGYYGAMLARSGQEVHFLFHNDYEQVREHGLYVKSCNGDFRLNPVHAYHSTEEMPVVDVVIVALKTTNNHLLRSLLPPLMDRNTMVLLIQNGIGVEEDVQRDFPQTPLAAGLAFICSSKTEPGIVNHQHYGSINLGNYSCTATSHYGQLLTELQQAGIQAHDIEYQEARWKKAVWNMPFNGMTVAMNTQTIDLLRVPAMMHTIREQMLEVIHAAWACGVKGIGEVFADKMIQNTLNMVPYSPSMKLDHDFGRKMEIDYLYTRPLSIAREHGFVMHRLEMLEAQLRFLEQHA